MTLLARASEVDAEPSLRAAARIVTPAAKYWICRRDRRDRGGDGRLGGNGYDEENSAAAPLS